MREIQEHIDGADRLAKQKADATIEVISENYKNILSSRLEYELAAAQECRRIRNQRAAHHHEMLASIYKSLLERIT